MNRSVKTMLSMAADIATKERDQRTFYIGCVAIRNDGAIVASRNEACREPHPLAHAEARVSRKIDYGAVLFVARVAKVNSCSHYAMAKPCDSCQNFLKKKKVKKVYFTTGPNSWECLNLS